jgi:hypothetical protein
MYRQTINGMHFNSIANLIRLWKFYSKVLSQFDIERNSVFIFMTYYFSISHFISLSESLIIIQLKFNCTWIQGKLV